MERRPTLPPPQTSPMWMRYWFPYGCNVEKSMGFIFGDRHTLGLDFEILMDFLLCFLIYNVSSSSDKMAFNLLSSLIYVVLLFLSHRKTFNESLTEDSSRAALNIHSSRLMLLFYTHLCIYLISSGFHKFSTIFFQNMEHKALHLMTAFSLYALFSLSCLFNDYQMHGPHLLNILTAVSKWCFCVSIDFIRNQ